MRFLVQWIYSEKHKESVIPIQFWYLSICGGIILLITGFFHDIMIGNNLGTTSIFLLTFKYFTNNVITN